MANPRPVGNPDGRPPDPRDLQRAVPIRFPKVHDKRIRARAKKQDIPYAEVVREIVAQAMEASK